MKIRKYDGTDWVQQYPEVNVDAIVTSNDPDTATGTASDTFLRGDGSWQTVASSFNGGTITSNLTIDSASFASLTLDRESTTSSSIVQFTNNGGVVGGVGGFGNDGLQFRTTDGTQMVIDASNNVGIGTTSPASKLEVAGDIQLQRSNELIFGETVGGSARAIIFSTENEFSSDYNGIGFSVGNQGRTGPSMYIRSNGNVGIGDTTPSYKLEVAGDIAVNKIFDRNNGSYYLDPASTSIVNLLQVGLSGGSYKTQLQTNALEFDRDGTSYIQQLGTGNIAFRFGSGYTIRALLTNDGKLGIGDTNPAEKLTVSGKIRANDNFQHTGTGGYYLYTDLVGFRGAFYDNGTSTLIYGDGDGTNPIITLESGNATFANDVTVTGDLTVSGTTTTMNTTVSTTDQWTVTNAGTDVATIINQTGTADILNLRDNGTTVFTVKDGGNVGIGTTNPDEKLHIEGNLLVDAYNNSPGDSGIFFREGYTASQPSGATQPYNVSITLYDGSNAGASYDGLAINGFDGVAVRTNNDSSPKLLVRKDGYVGIGATNPGAKLDVEGAGIFNSDAGQRVLYLRQSSAGYGNIVQFQGASNQNVWEMVGRDSHFYIYNNDQSKHSIFIEDSNNYVGIGGTQTPLAALNVHADSGLYITTENNAPTDGAQIRFSDHSSQAQYGFIRYKHANQSVETEPVNSDDGFIIGGSETNTVVSIQGSLNVDGQTNFENQVEIDSGNLLVRAGNVGIGTASPSEKLEVIGNFKIKTGSGYSNYGLIDQTEAKMDIKTYSSNTGTHDADITFQPNLTEAMRIQMGGNVGIGTTSPTQKLEVDGNINANELHLNDTNTIIKEGSNNTVRLQTNNGYVDIGPENTSWAHFRTDRGSFYFNKPVQVDGNIALYDNNTTKLENSTGYIYELGNRVLTEASDVLQSYDFEPGSSAGSRRFVRLFTINGFNNTSGASADVILSGAGDYGDFDRTSLRILAGERGGNVTVDVFSFNSIDTTDAPIIYHKNAGTTNSFEIWAQLADYNYTHKLSVLNKQGGFTVNLDSTTTTTPSSLTTVTQKQILHTGGKVTSDLTLEYSFPRIRLTDTDDNSDYSIINSNGSFSVYDDTNGAYRFRINSAGNITVGDASASNLGFLEKSLEIQAGSSSDTTLKQAGLVISGSSDADDADDFAYLSFRNNHSSLSNDRVAELRIVKDGTNVDTANMKFYTANGTSLAARMTLTNDGKLGIGTESPGSSLEVVGDIQANRMYDRSNTSYYVDPASTSVLYNLSVLNSTTMANDLTLDHDGTGITADSHGIVFTARTASTDFTRELLMDETGDLVFNGNALATEAYVTANAGGGTLDTTSIEIASASNTTVDISGFSSSSAIVILRARQFGIATATYVGKISDITTSSLYKQELHKGSTLFCKYYRSSTQIIFSNFASSVSVDCYEMEVS